MQTVQNSIEAIAIIADVIKQDNTYITLLKPKTLRIVSGMQEQIEPYIVLNGLFTKAFRNIIYKKVSADIISNKKNYIIRCMHELV